MKLSFTAQAAPALKARPAAADRRRLDHRFQLALALSFLLTALCGFGPSYYLRPAMPAPPLSLVVHVHAALFSGWLLLLLVQTALVSAGRVGQHRRLGVIGAVLAVAMVPAGVATAIHTARSGATLSGKNPIDLLVFQFGALLLFIGFVAVALFLRRSPEHHRRLLMLATVSIIPPAIARLPFVGLRPPLAVALSLLFVLAAIIHDLRSRGRVHPAYVWGGLVLLASGPLRMALGQTSAWQAFARFLVS